MGFFGRTPPRPEPTEDLETTSPKHTHTWYDTDGTRRRYTCSCDTGQDHTTPKND